MSAHQQQFTSSEIKRFSTFLHRDVILTIILPMGFKKGRKHKLLLINDGQDLAPINMVSILSDLQHKLYSFITVGIHANENRIQEYGTANQPDYANRGALAGQTEAFVLQELLPFLKTTYNIFDNKITYAGFSLGGLMAIDTAWNHPDKFTHTAIFSGSLWWRQKALDEGYCDRDRIMHAKIRNSVFKAGLNFWFQCGGKDETDDRDEDGVIDSIQDTLECIAELERKGYRWGKDITYMEIPDGEHDLPTWAKAMPAFLIWAFGKQVEVNQTGSIW